MDFELLTCLLKFIEHFPDYLSVLSRMLLRFFWTTFVETVVNTHLAASPWLQVFRLANKAQLILKLSFFVSILVLVLVFLRKCNHGLQNFLTVVINKSVSKATQKNGYKFERKY